MPVTIIKTKIEKAASGLHEAVEDGLKELVDPLGHAKMQMDVAGKKHKALKTVYDKKAKEYLGIYNDEEHKPADVGVTVGESFIATVSAEGKVRSMNDLTTIFGMLEDVKEGLAMELMKFNLGDLDQYLTKDQLEEVLDTNYTGKRSLKLQALGN